MRPHTFLDNHRGPFRLVLTRARVNPKDASVRYPVEWTAGEVAREDVRDEAQALLDDPRDTIVAVHVWSLTEGQFVGGYPDKGSV